MKASSARFGTRDRIFVKKSTLAASFGRGSFPHDVRPVELR
jgi:hypothetical protein